MVLSDEDRTIRTIRKIGVGVLLLGVILLIISWNADTGLLDFHFYEFGIEADSNEQVQLRDFQIFYDFVKYEGSINFELSHTNHTKSIVFRLPVNIKVTVFNWTSKNKDFLYYYNGTDYIEDSTIQSTNPIHLTFVIENIKMDKKEYESTIELKFKGKLYPNAEFRFKPSAYKIIPPSGNENGAFFKFNLGNKYTCAVEPCKESFRKEELEFHYRDNKLTVATQKDL